VRRNSLYDPRYRSIVNRLVQARRDAGLNQEELAQKIAIGQPEVSRIERFARKIEVLELVDWIKATNAEDLAVVARILDSTLVNS
jgi:transcriptional regulator with XRE-family HTH domain